MRLRNHIDLISGYTPFSEDDARAIFRELTEAVQHCHEHYVVLRSINLDNIALERSPVTGRLCVKLADLSEAVMNSDTSSVVDHPLFAWSKVNFLSPEILQRELYTYPSDIWSLGVVLYALLSGTVPFHSEIDDHLIHAIKVSFTCLSIVSFLIVQIGLFFSII